MFQADVGVEVEGGRGGGVLAKSAVRIILIDLGATPAARRLLYSLHFELLFIFASLLMKIEAKFKSILVYEFTEYNGC